MTGNKEIPLSIIQTDKDKFLTENNIGDIYLEYGGYLIEKYNLNITKEELLKLRWMISHGFILNEVKYKEGVVEVIKYLKKLNYILILATAGTREQVDIYSYQNIKTSSELNLYNYFDLILTKEDVEKKKPDSEIFLKILTKLNANSSECIVIEDSLNGIKSAKGAHITTINIYEPHCNNEREEIDKITDFKINDYQELLNYLKENYPITNNQKIRIKEKY